MVQMGRVTPAPSFAAPPRPRAMPAPAPTGTAGNILMGLNSAVQGYQQGAQLGSWMKNIARERFGIDMRSPKEMQQAARVNEIMSNPAPTLPELIELRTISPENFEIFNDGLTRSLKIQNMRTELQRKMGKMRAEDREREMDAMVFEMKGKLFKPDGSMNMDVAQMLRAIAPAELQEQIKVGTYLKDMSKPRREIATTVNDMMAGVLNRIRHTPEEGRAAAWRQAKRQLAMQMKSMKSGNKDNPVNGVVEWAVKDLENMFRDGETGLLNFDDESVDNVLTGMAQFHDQVQMYAVGKDVKKADEIASGDMPIGKLRAYVEAADRQGLQTPIVNMMRAQLQLQEAELAERSGAGVPDPQQPENRQQRRQARQQARQTAIQGRGLALDLFGGSEEEPPAAPAAGPPQPAAPGPAGPAAGGPAPPARPPQQGAPQQGPAPNLPPPMLALEAAEQGGLPYDPAPAPRDPGNREPGTVYRLPDGRNAFWDGQQWAVMDRGGGNPPNAEPPVGMGRQEDASVEEGEPGPARYPAPPPAAAPRQSRTNRRLIEAVTKAESGGDPTAQSPKGARGLMQVMPETAKTPGMGVPNVFEVADQMGVPYEGESDAEAERLLEVPEVNRQLGTQYLEALMERYEGNTRKALVAYNWGPTNADKWNGDEAALPKETRDYLSRVSRDMGGLPGDSRQSAQIARRARTELSVPRNGYSGRRLTRAVRDAVQKYGGDERSWRKILSGKVSQTLRSISDQGELDLQRHQCRPGRGGARQGDRPGAAVLHRQPRPRT